MVPIPIENFTTKRRSHNYLGALCALACPEILLSGVLFNTLLIDEVSTIRDKKQQDDQACSELRQSENQVAVVRWVNVDK